MTCSGANLWTGLQPLGQSGSLDTSCSPRTTSTIVVVSLAVSWQCAAVKTYLRFMRVPPHLYTIFLPLKGFLYPSRAAKGIAPLFVVSPPICKVNRGLVKLID